LRDPLFAIASQRQEMKARAKKEDKKE